LIFSHSATSFGSLEISSGFARLTLGVGISKAVVSELEEFQAADFSLLERQR
jgi:hypothetical protein